MLAAAAHAATTLAGAGDPNPAVLSTKHDLERALDAHLSRCPRLFLDGGANTGESVRAFVAGGFYGCALNGPNRLYPKAWPRLPAAERRRRMAPLRSPSGWCVRSFESNSALLPPLLEQQAELRRAGHDVRFVGAALSNVTAVSAPRTIVQFARNKWGSTATTLPFADIFPRNKPPQLSVRVEHGPSYDVLDVLARARQLNRSSVIALKLDVEGDEEWMIERLSRHSELLCALSYLFVEFHHLPKQRANLTRWGLDEDLYEIVKNRIHALMEERPGCKLQVYWRSFWAACGDRQRFEWLNAPQVTDREADGGILGGGRPRGRAAKRGRRRRGRE